MPGFHIGFEVSVVLFSVVVFLLSVPMAQIMIKVPSVLVPESVHAGSLSFSFSIDPVAFIVRSQMGTVYAKSMIDIVDGSSFVDVTVLELQSNVTRFLAPRSFALTFLGWFVVA